MKYLAVLLFGLASLTASAEIVEGECWQYDTYSVADLRAKHGTFKKFRDACRQYYMNDKDLEEYETWIVRPRTEYYNGYPEPGYECLACWEGFE